MLFSIGAGVFFACAFRSASVPDLKNSRTASTDDSGAVTLILLRHAKSDKSNMSIPDIDRPLEESGREEAREMGEYLKKNVRSIDAICSSPAVRTRQTLEIICPMIGFDINHVKWDSSLYACTGDHLIQTIRNNNSWHRTVLYVGHNPSITGAANALQTERTIDEVKTCGAVSIYFPVSSWKEISADSSRLNFYVKPQ